MIQITRNGISGFTDGDFAEQFMRSNRDTGIRGKAVEALLGTTNS